MNCPTCTAPAPNQMPVVDGIVQHCKDPYHSMSLVEIFALENPATWVAVTAPYRNARAARRRRRRSDVIHDAVMRDLDASVRKELTDG